MAGASAARVSDASALQDAIARWVPHIVAEGRSRACRWSLTYSCLEW